MTTRNSLACTPDPPRTLYGLGDPAALAPGLGVVGARKATPYGLQAAAQLAGWAARAGYVVVSGGAIGCDQAAHRAALDAGGHNRRRDGGRADVAYPRGAAELLRLDRRASGAVVSEHPWGTPPLSVDLQDSQQNHRGPLRGAAGRRGSARQRHLLDRRLRTCGRARRLRGAGFHLRARMRGREPAHPAGRDTQ